MVLFSFRNLSIRYKLVAIVMCAVSLVVVLISLFFMAYEVTSTRSMLSKIFAVRTTILSSNLSAALAFDDRASAEETLLSLKADPNVVGAWVQTKDGALFAQYDRDPAHPSAVPLAGIQDQLRFETNSLSVTRRWKRSKSGWKLPCSPTKSGSKS